MAITYTSSPSIESLKTSELFYAQNFLQLAAPSTGDDRHSTPSESKEVDVIWTRQALRRDTDELERLDRGLGWLHDEMTRIQGLIMQFDGRRKHVQNNIFIHKSKIHPLRTLPVELLQEIFKQCLPGQRTRPNSHEAPLLFGRICRRWRAIAYATPELWVGIALEDSGYWISALEMSMTQEWLNRAKSRPLAVKLHSVSTSGHSAGFASPLLSLFMSHESHLSHLSLAGQWDYLWSFLCNATSLPMLQNLDLTLLVGRYNLLGMGRLRFTSQPLFPRLTHLTLMPQAHPDVTLQILTQCPSLRRLTMKSSSTSLSGVLSQVITGEHFVHEGLQVLEISSDGTPSGQNELIECGPLFTVLTLPSLRILSISIGERCIFPVSIESWVLLPQLLSLVDRSACPLEKVMFHNCRVDVGGPALTELFQYTPLVVAGPPGHPKDFHRDVVGTSANAL